MENKNKNKITQGIARVSWLGLVLLGAINLSCGDGDGKSKNGDDKDKAGGSGGDTIGATVDTKKPLTIKLKTVIITEDLAANANTTGDAAHVLTLQVTDGKDDTAGYKLKVVESNYFKQKKFSDPETDAGKQVNLTTPADDATLKVLCSVDELKKDDEFQIPVVFTAGSEDPTGGTQVKVKIVDNAGSDVSNQVTLAWRASS